MAPLQYAVGIKLNNRTDQLAVEAEDALIAALKAKIAHPEATITYVRKRNARGDRRHPHSGLVEGKRRPERDAAAGRTSLRRDRPGRRRPLIDAGRARREGTTKHRADVGGGPGRIRTCDNTVMSGAF